MKTVTVHEDSFIQLQLLARALHENEAQVVRELLREYRLSGERKSTTDREELSPLSVFATYDGFRVKGSFDPTTGTLLVLNGPLEGQRFASPSGAAVAHVHAVNPNIAANRNGWYFWIIEDTGEALQTIRRR